MLTRTTSDLWTGYPNHQPIKLLRYSRNLGDRDNQEPLISGVFDSVLCIKLGPPSILNDTACPSSFHHPPVLLDLRRTDWAKFQTHLEELLPYDPELHVEMAIDSCVENFSAPF